MKYLISLCLFTLLSTSCKHEQKNKYNLVDKSSNVEVISPEEAQQLMQNKCYLCHNPTASQQNRVGPPMAAIKARYLRDASTKEEFVAAIWNFTAQPSKENAKLKGAVKRFGVMPYQKFNQEEIEAIASYMYDYQIEEPEWFKVHWEDHHNGKYQQQGKKIGFQNQESKDFATIGMEYALSTKAQLGKNLMGAIQNQGELYALDFCNVRAMPITDSMAVVYHATIKRVSDLNRNPANKANAKELNYINNFKKVIAEGNEPTPIIEESETKVHFYYPIVTNDMCLKCHGTLGKEIKIETYNKIKTLYPTDKAIGYTTNEVRGIWSIEFDKNVEE